MTETDSSLEQRHARFQTPEALIFDLIKDQTGCAPVKRTKIVRGYDNEVYDVATREGSAFIVKIKQYGEMSFEQEQWAMDRCWEVGVPVPRTYAIGSVQIAEKEREYLIQEKASGQPLAESIDTLSRSQITHVFHQAGELLRRIHQVKVEGFYRRQQDSTWDFPSWKRLGDANVRDRAQEIAWIRQAGFSHGEVETMLHDLERYRDEFTCEQPVLCHGDYVPEHIFLDEELHISALLDFGMFLGNHPIHDFALYNPAPPALRLQALREGYGDHEMFRDRFQERLLLHRLGLQMGELAYHAREGMQPEAERLSRRLRETLRTVTKSRYIRRLRPNPSEEQGRGASIVVELGAGVRVM